MPPGYQTGQFPAVQFPAPPGQFPGQVPPGQYPPPGYPGGPGPYPPGPAKKSRTGLIIGIAVAAVVLLLGTVTAVVIAVVASGEDFPVGSCVVRSGSGAKSASCSDPGAFKVVKKVDDQTKCADPNQPVVEVRGGRKDSVLCLAPAG